MSSKKIKNECQFCRSRFCNYQIYRDEVPLYDEVYCKKHIKEAEEECNRVLGNNKGIFRIHRSSTGFLSRSSR